MSFELVVDDNGRGFSPEAKSRSIPDGSGRLLSGNGLENMTRRLAGIGGTCDIQSAPGAGTKITFTVRLKASAL